MVPVATTTSVPGPSDSIWPKPAPLATIIGLGCNNKSYMFLSLIQTGMNEFYYGASTLCKGKLKSWGTNGTSAPAQRPVPFGLLWQGRLLIWRQMLRAGLCMEANFGGGFTYGGGSWRRIYIWRRNPGVDLLVEANFGGNYFSVYYRDVSGQFSCMEVDAGGRFTYGGQFWRLV
jgi:hypothetical protein